MLRQHPISVMFMLVGVVLTALAGALIGQPTHRSPALQMAFVGGADNVLELRGGTFTATMDAAPSISSTVTAGAKDALVLESQKPLTGSRQMTARVRLRTNVAAGAEVHFWVGWKDAKEPGFHMGIQTSKGVPHVSCQVHQHGNPLHDAAALAKTLDWTPEVHNEFTYYPRAYPFSDIRPGWPEDYRARIEHDMAELPDVPDKWLSLRIEVRPGEARFWIEDRLAAHKKGSDLPCDGLTRLQLSPGVQLAGYEVSPWKEMKPFEPIHLDGYANARAFVGGGAVKPESLPPGNPTVLGGVPFVLPRLNAEGNDHIDLGRSLFRQANLPGYLETFGPPWFGSARRDPARIQLRIPNGFYDTLYLLAGADDRSNHIPLVSAMFYRPAAGFSETFEAEVPLATAQSSGAKPLTVTLANGKQANLWLVKIPLDPGRLSSFADMDIIEVELTKKVQQYRSYPDPILYGWHQAGLPSSVHVYGLTLGTSPVAFTFTPDKFGHVWTAPDVPTYTARLTNASDADQTGALTIHTRSYDGSMTTNQEKKAVHVPRGATTTVPLSVPVILNGYHDIAATLRIAGKTWTEKRSFVRLAPDTRAERWTEGQGPLFGYWSYHGGHHTPKADRIIELMTRAGARASIGVSNPEHPLVKKHWGRISAGAWEVAPQPWAMEEPYDPKKYADFQKEVLAAFTKARQAIPPQHLPDHVYFFPEPHVSQRLTEGNYPEYWHGEPYRYTEDEKKRLRMFLVTAKCAAEAVRKQFPDLKILIPWGDALFAVPLLRAGFPKNLIDGSGVDTPGFERLPEMQLHQISVHRLYQLRKEYEKAGITNPRLQYNEGIFVPTEPGAVSWREQMDLYNRWTLLSLAYGVQRFYSGWFAFDCGNYYGAEHYGGCGIQRRIPYCDPKPAYAAYATMTDRLDRANFDGWLKTGSLSTYCLRFKGSKGNVYTLWTLRGQRPVTLTLAGDGDVHVTDAMNNTRTLKSRNKQVTVNTDPSVLYVTGPEVTGVAAGQPDHSDVKPGKEAKLVADLGDGSWDFISQRNKVYENGTFAVQRFPGKFRSESVNDPVQGKVLRSTLGKQDRVHELMPWYGILTPKKPIVLGGAPSHLGLWVKGSSDWGRVIYTLRDAKGERWTSIGTQDQYNCDDVHSWSAFNFDGWRYLRFELPGHTGYDNFRKHGTTWYRSDKGDGIVDLPLTLENIIVEQRSHILYVNDVQAAASDAVELGKLYAEYATPADAAPQAVAQSQLRMPPPPAPASLPNPIAQLTQQGMLPPTAITKLEPPLDRNDGTTVHVHFKEAPAAKSYFVWVSAHPDGRGAVNMTPSGAKSGALIAELRPALKLYFWVTYQDAQGKTAKPSPAASATLVDMFQEK